MASKGFGRQLTELHEWCHTHVAAGQWAQHGCVARRDDRGVPLEALVKRYAADAMLEAAARAGQLLKDGDWHGAATWHSQCDRASGIGNPRHRRRRPKDAATGAAPPAMSIA